MGAFTYVGASSFVYSMRSVDPEHLLRTIAEAGTSFTSLVPTHYIMMQALPEAVRNRYNVDRIRKLLGSTSSMARPRPAG
jgi:acyl-coenzyme A synthetase/AMP-(fatty) acid ligase